MATTITSNYFAIDVARTTTAGGEFTLDIPEILKSKCRVIEIAVVETTVAPNIRVTLPKIEVINGMVDFEIIIRDAHRYISNIVPTIFEIYPFDDGAGYSDCIGYLPPGTQRQIKSGEGIILGWCASASSTLSPNSGYWRVSAGMFP